MCCTVIAREREGGREGGRERERERERSPTVGKVHFGTKYNTVLTICRFKKTLCPTMTDRVRQAEIEGRGGKVLSTLYSVCVTCMHGTVNNGLCMEQPTLLC